MRLIDADALNNELIERQYSAQSMGVLHSGYPHMMAIVSKQPTVDAVPVVRCKDCVWFGKAGCAILIVDDSDKPREYDFCSYGERKDNG